jgi:hypothetical protein
VTITARATDPRTSHEAAQGKRNVADEILAAFRRRPVKGWTDFELEPVIIDKTGVSPQRVRTVRAELTGWFHSEAHGRKILKPIQPVYGETRKTPRGLKAQVFRLA